MSAATPVPASSSAVPSRPPFAGSADGTERAGTAPGSGRAAAGRRRWTGWHAGLSLIALASGLLTVWSVGTASMSTYYASIALSMSESWTAFLFGSVDPASTVTLDKIPGSFWIPALFVRLFGFSTTSVILPNALAAVAAAVLVAVTAKRLLGPVAGLVAGAVAATTPILVAVSRSNQPETFFVLGLAATAWAATHAVRRASFRWLMIAGLFIAASFQTYMIEAWAVWPALAAAWLCTRGTWWRRLRTLAVAGVTSLAASLWWIVVVSLVPADSRPYIGSTLSNSPWEMVFGYNALGRFSSTADAEAYRSFTPPFSGDPSAFRLFNEQLAGQVAWLLPTAVLGVLVLWRLRFPRPLTVLLGVWLLTFAIMFSAVGGMHQFYTAALAVPTALLVGLAYGLAHRRRVVWARVALLAVAAATALAIGVGYGGYSIVVAIVQALLAGTAIALVVRGGRRRGAGRVGRRVAAAVAGASLVLTPLVWSVVTIAHPSAVNPVAGGVAEMGGAGMGGTGRAGAGGAAGSPGAVAPGSLPQGLAPPDGSAAANGTTGSRTRADGMSGGVAARGGGTGAGGMGAGGGSADAALLAYLTANQGGATYLAATFGAQSAAELIIASNGGEFLPIGGFDGSDAVPTLDRLQELVRTGALRYVVMGGQAGSGGAPGAGGDGRAGSAAGGTAPGAPTASASGTSAEIRTWVEQRCTPVTVDGSSATVYECVAA